MAGKYYISGYCTIQDSSIQLNGQEFFSAPDAAFTDFAKQAYKHAQIDYAKFFKMDNLSKLSFLAADLLLKQEAADKENL